MSKQALGRGFDGLIPINLDVDSVASGSEQIKHVVIDKIVPNPEQPRKEFDQDALKELADSIVQHGIIQPLVVTPTDNGLFRIVAGERRYRASLIAGLSKLPVIVRNHKELEELEIALVENVQRVDLSPLEQAVSVVRLRDQFSLGSKDIAKKLGKAETTVSNIIRLLQLPKSAITALQQNQITEGHARAILALRSDPKKQELLLAKILKEGLSVRESEEFAKEQKQAKEQSSYSVSKPLRSWIESVENRGIKVKFSKRKKGGTISLTYSDDTDLLDILSGTNN